MVVIGHWLGQLADQAFGDFTGMFLGIKSANEHANSSSYQARHHIVTAHDRRRRRASVRRHRRHRGQQVSLIGLKWSRSISSRARLSWRRMASAICACVLDQVAAVWQVGQRVMPGRMLQFLFTQRQALISAFQFGGTLVHVVCSSSAKCCICPWRATIGRTGCLFLPENLDAVSQ